MGERSVGREWLVRLLLIASSSLLSLYAVEILAGFVLPFPAQEGQGIIAAKRLGRSVDERDMSDFIEDARAEGKQIVPAFSPAVILNDFLREEPADRVVPTIFPLSGVANAPTAGFNESGYRRVYESDRFGFNNPDAIYSEPIDVALIGDSYTAGITVYSDEEIAAHLRRASYNALNLGSNANGPLIELATLVEYAQVHQPPIVVWIFYEGNDLFDLGRERQHPTLMSYLEQPSYQQDLRNRQSAVDGLVKQKIAQLEAEKKAEKAAANDSAGRKVVERLMLTRVRGAIAAWLNPQAAAKIYADSDENLALFAAVLERADSIVSSWDGELYFVYLPVYERFSSNRTTLEKLNTRQQMVLEQVKALGIPSIDIAARFEQEDDPLALFPFGFFGHYDADGYKVVADEIMQVLPDEP